MDREIRDRLDSIDRKLDAVIAGPQRPAASRAVGAAPNGTLISMLFWLVIVAVLAGVWAFAGNLDPRPAVPTGREAPR